MVNTSTIHQAVAATAHALSPPHHETIAQHNAELKHMVASRIAAHDVHKVQNDDDENDKLNPIVAILLIYGILFLMIAAQAALVLWRKRHQRSYDLVTLVGLWLIPPMFCIQLHFWRFLVIWVVYSCVTGYLISLCMKKKMESTTPRMVYSWFIGAFRISVFVGGAGYILLLLEMMGLAPLIYLLLPKGASIDLVWYGLYFGVLGRDCAEVASDRMAAMVGSGGRRLLNTANSCGICGNEMQDFSHMGEQVETVPPEGVEPCVQLSCKHCFHNLCIRGWTMVGKKDVCPVCMEKVDLRELYADRPWETRNLTWIQMLDTVRYLVVWNPIILMVLSVLLHFLPHPHHHHHHGPPGMPGLATGSPIAHALAGASPPLHSPVLTLGTQHGIGHQ